MKMKTNTSIRLTTRTYPWIVIALCSIFLFYKYILQVSPSVMTNDLMRYFHISGAGLGNLAATFFYSYLIIQLFAGPLLDRYSPRLLMTIAIFICALGTMIFASATHLYLALLGRMMVGAGSAFATVGYMKMAATYFPPKQFAFIGGLLATAAMVGALLGETPLSLMVDQFGWHYSLLVISVVGFLITILFWSIVRDSSVKITDSRNEVSTISFKQIIAVLRKKHNWMLAFYSGLAFSPVAVFGGLWGNPFLQEAYHLSRTQASEFVSLVFMGLAFGGPILGWISDRLQNRLLVMTVGSSLSLLTMSLSLFIVLPLPILGLSLFLFGFGTGAFMLGFAMGKEINPAFMAGTVIALINTGDAIFGAVTEPSVGKLLDYLWHGHMQRGAPYFSVVTYQKALAVLCVYLAVALVIVGFMKRSNITKHSVGAIDF